MTTQHIQEKKAKSFSLISFKFSQRIDSDRHALTVGCLIAMHNVCMKLTVCTKMAALQTSFEGFIKIGNPQQCPLKLTGQNRCSNYLMPWSSSVKAVEVYLKLKFKEQFVRSVLRKLCHEVVAWRELEFTWNWNWNWKNSLWSQFSGNHAICLLLELEITTFKFSWMDTLCSMHVELTSMGLWNWAVEGQLFRGERHEKGCEGRRHWTCEQIVCKKSFA